MSLITYRLRDSTKILLSRRLRYLKNRSKYYLREFTNSIDLTEKINSQTRENNEISKYIISKYYYELAKLFEEIANKRKISKSELWEHVKGNIILRGLTNVEQRTYKNIFIGRNIPMGKDIGKILLKYDDLPSYLSIIYLDENISPEMEKAYSNLMSLH